ncbi:hypothetical protein [Nakamurella leprariae]|uniref:Uncharacterized protein n=1 Tax=Nakamurella leprariae TaxID=2803911 RepID=A0A938YEX6_9ACTN|nr:hypothetical protein [Nakamurella leprariae]MBM9468291.1 hypothetical protein [Nakamurella leprariae]
MSESGQSAQQQYTVDDPPDLPLQVLEEDETVPPRPEEELADVERSEPQR